MFYDACLGVLPTATVKERTQTHKHTHTHTHSSRARVAATRWGDVRSSKSGAA